MAHPQIVRNVARQRKRHAELRRVVAVHRVRRQKCLHADAGRVEYQDLRVARYRDGVGLAVVAALVVGRAVAVASGNARPEVEESPPALARAVARFVIAAHENPRRRGEQRSRRRESPRPTRPSRNPTGCSRSRRCRPGRHFPDSGNRRRGSPDPEASPRPRPRPARMASARDRCTPGTRCPETLMRQPVSPITTMRLARVGQQRERSSGDDGARRAMRECSCRRLAPETATVWNRPDRSLRRSLRHRLRRGAQLHRSSSFRRPRSRDRHRRW